MDAVIRTKSFTIDRSAYLKALWTRGLWKGLLILSVTLLVAAALLGVLGGLSAAIGVIEGGFGLVPILIPLRYFLSRRNVFGERSAKIFDDPRTFEFSETGLSVKSEGGIESLVPWTYVQEVERRGDFTLLMLGQIQYLIVSNSAFKTHEDSQSFRRLLDRKIAAKGRRRVRSSS